MSNREQAPQGDIIRSVYILCTPVWVILVCTKWPKYLKMSTTHREGRWRGRGRGTEARSAGVPRGVGSGEGRRSPSPVWGFGGIAPRKFRNLTVQICSFFKRFQDRDSSSIRCFSFIYCLYLFIIDHSVVFRKVNIVLVKQNSEI